MALDIDNSRWSALHSHRPQSAAIPADVEPRIDRNSRKLTVINYSILILLYTFFFKEDGTPFQHEASNALQPRVRSVESPVAGHNRFDGLERRV